MCRIAGIYNPQSQNVEADVLKMRDAMHRGGPDDHGIFIHSNLNLAFGHNRLSILDLSSAGHQPMQTPDGKLQITFSGEIYNFREIRAELKKLGYTFRTETDTEVILYSYQQWGKECFQRFNGMFALAIWDEKQKEIVLARDRAGIKPLYYHINDGLFFFSSEIRAINNLFPQWPAETSWKPLFLMFGHLPEPYTTLKNVITLGKGEWLSVQLPNMVVKQDTYYQEEYTSEITNEDDAIALMRDILPKAVKRHLISDAPIGLFLSGGIDSSLLTLLASSTHKDQLQTLSVQFNEEAFSEEHYQQMIISITESKHSFCKISQADFEETLPDIFNAMDQPSTDAINSYFISRHAKKCRLKSVLSGIGADEFFGGYPSFHRFNRWKYSQRLPSFVTKNIGKINNRKLEKFSFKNLSPMLSLYLMNRGFFTVAKASMLTGSTVQEIEQMLEKISLNSKAEYSSLNSNAMMETDLYMKNQLLKDADYMSMWHGIEIRVPFLDKELTNAVNSISPLLKFGSDLPKKLLIESFSTMLPAEIWHRKKQGFTFPFNQWLKKSSGLMPETKNENVVFNDFQKNEVHWSRYWAVKVAGVPKFN
jgi:asparagine synthase (glutamine-hydrolysing)